MPEKMSEGKSKETKSQEGKVTNVKTSKNVKLCTFKEHSKNPKQMSTSKSSTYRIKNLVCDCHMTPGYKGDK